MLLVAKHDPKPSLHGYVAMRTNGFHIGHFNTPPEMNLWTDFSKAGGHRRRKWRLSEDFVKKFPQTRRSALLVLYGPTRKPTLRNGPRRCIYTPPFAVRSDAYIQLDSRECNYYCCACHPTMCDRKLQR